MESYASITEAFNNPENQISRNVQKRTDDGDLADFVQSEQPTWVQRYNGIMKDLDNKLTSGDIDFGDLEVSNPTKRAATCHDAFLSHIKLNRPKPEVLFVGMNPGRFSMRGNGIPFGDKKSVDEFLGISYDTNVPDEKEESGERFWTFVKYLYGDSETFFRRCFVWNYCPLLILKDGLQYNPAKMQEEGCNGNEDMDRRHDQLTRKCNNALRELLTEIKPKFIIGVGGYTFSRIDEVLKALGSPESMTPVFIYHPSPLSDYAPTYQIWKDNVVSQLKEVLPTMRDGLPPLEQ